MAMFPEVDPPRKGAVSLEEIQAAYEKKINAYLKLIEGLQNEQKSLIKNITNPKSTMTLNKFMQRAEEIGIAKMNHQTIIEMLNKQYREWFGGLPEALNESYKAVVADKYKDMEIL